MRRSELQKGSTFGYLSSVKAFREKASVYWVPDGGECPNGAIESAMLPIDDDEEVILIHEPSSSAQNQLGAAVTNLPYYKKNKIEAIDVIEDWDLGPHLANVIKYIARHGDKPGVDAKDDLRKARAYLTRKINLLGGKASWRDEDSASSLADRRGNKSARTAS